LLTRSLQHVLKIFIKSAVEFLAKADNSKVNLLISLSRWSIASEVTDAMGGLASQQCI